MAAAIHAYRSNRTEVLAGVLAKLAAEPLAGPFANEWVVVQSRGMATWLAMEVARQGGVCAGVEFLYPRRFVERIYSLGLPDANAGDSGFDRDHLLWAVMASLSELLPQPELARLQGYLGEDPRGVRRLQLARHIGVVFDQYATYRPEMVRAWDAGEDAPCSVDDLWQPRLWRAVRQRLRTAPLALLEPDFLAAMHAEAALVGLPRRVLVFGIASLPPLHIRALISLAQRVEVHLFSLSPSRQHWTESLSARDEHWQRRRGGGSAELHLDHGPPLLASLGGLAAEFANLWQDALDGTETAEIEPAEELFVEPAPDRALGRLQADLLDLRDPAPAAADAPRPILGEDDRSIAVHSCHGPMREVEVLHDQLLGLLAEDTGLEPRDVIVMMPDVDAYAPLIEAVFDRAGDGAIPYRIADRTVRSESPLIEALQRTLALVGGRLPASAVLDLLRLEPVQRQFGIAAEDIDEITRWVSESGIRWGRDAAHRAANGQPALEQNTWRFGLTRMLLGYAMPTDGRATFAGWLPYEEIEGHAAEPLGRLADYCRVLFSWLERLEQPRSLRQWRDDLVLMIDEMYSGEVDARQLIRAALTELYSDAAAVGFDDVIDLSALTPLLEPKIERAHPERGFLRGGVTFCAFMPMRSIPFAVVCMMGMADDAFPRSQRSVDFDLMARGPRQPGDRSRRADDRFLFLEAILAARQRLLITYTGQSIRDNSVSHPSVVVSELLEQLIASNDPPGWSGGMESDRVAALRQRIELRHPLQGFSRRYFDRSCPRLFSYAEFYLAGARSAAAARAPVPSPFAEPLPADPEADPGSVAIDDLVRFFRSPAGFLLNRRLGVYLGDADLDIADREPLELDPLERFGVGDRLLQLHLGGADPGEIQSLVRAAGRLPFGRLGNRIEGQLSGAAAAIAQQTIASRGASKRRALEVRRRMADGTELHGVLADVWGTGLVSCQFARVKARNQLELWLRHLALCWTQGDRAHSTLIGRGENDAIKVVSFGFVADAEARLLELLELYRAGQVLPLLLVPEASSRFVERRGKLPSPGSWADELKYDAHLQRVIGAATPPFREVVTAGPPFEEVAETVFGPLVAVRTEV